MATGPSSPSLRAAILHDLEILDTPAEPAYDDLARLASACCDSAIAAVNLVDDERHWTKAIVGVEGGQGTSVSADVSFCAATVATDRGLLRVSDTAQSDEWREHQFVTGPPFVRFYAGAAIVVSGEPVGVVCVFGDEPRDLAPRQEESLIALAAQASALLELRQRNAEREALIDELRQRERAEAQHKQALDLNDQVVQGLASAKLALEVGDLERGLRSVDKTLRDARKIVDRLLEERGHARPGDLVRSVPDDLGEDALGPVSSIPAVLRFESGVPMVWSIGPEGHLGLGR